ncbi:hypothetical protein CALCODRAFT_507040 [Calocera cornea HHB12733]|uniref:Uncharacterized protein n=1 Tax=Calocera cornea HHB12733 TaxID=1353952 RepID=A0A165I705_9BASI|nr:hypothetical protein CALCODRAFT_507040 [Calocera cornea HHB12733]
MAATRLLGMRNAEPLRPIGTPRQSRRRLALLDKTMEVVLLWMRSHDDDAKIAILAFATAGTALFRSATSARWHTIGDDELRTLLNLRWGAMTSGSCAEVGHICTQVIRGYANASQRDSRIQQYARHVRVMKLLPNALGTSPNGEQPWWHGRIVTKEWCAPFANLEALIVQVERPGDLLLIADWVCNSVREAEIVAHVAPGRSEEWATAVGTLMQALRYRASRLEILHVVGVPNIPTVFPDLLISAVQRHRMVLLELYLDAHALNEQMLELLRTCVALQAIQVTQRGPFFPVPRRQSAASRPTTKGNSPYMLEMTLKGGLYMMLSILQGMTIEPSTLRVHCEVGRESIYSAQQLSHTIMSTFRDISELCLELELEDGVESLPIALRLSDFECLGSAFHSLKRLRIVSDLQQAMVVCDKDLHMWLTLMPELEELILIWPEEFERMEEQSQLYDKQHRRVTFPGILRLIQPKSKLRHLYLGHIDFLSLMELPEIWPDAPPLELQTRTAEVGSVWETALVLQRVPHYISIAVDESLQSNVVSQALQYVKQAYEGRGRC